MKIYDLIGIGFGPSNIALAISMHERYDKSQVDMLFLEKQSSFAWHPNMMLNHTHMQISFLKDLVTPRNPTSKFSFLNYLASKNRLQDFINLKTFFPSRFEFNDYLAWCASYFDDRCVYDREALEIKPIVADIGDENGVKYLQIKCKDSEGKCHDYMTRSVVIATGGYGYIPDEFQAVKDSNRIFHSSCYLTKLEELKHQSQIHNIAVIGAGQSAAEIFMDLHDNHDVQVDLITRAWAFRPSDDSPFANEIFNPEFIDYVYDNCQQRRFDLLEEFRSTNYAAPDLEIIENIYKVLYLQKVTGDDKHTLLRRYEVKDSRIDDQHITLSINSLDTNEIIKKSYDAVILATGYKRNIHEKLLQPAQKYLQDFTVTRDYQMNASGDFQPVVFLQGCCEPTHGLGDTLLSNLSTRAEEICEGFEKRILAKTN